MLVWREPRATRKSCAAAALVKSAKHPLVLYTIARLFWADRKIDKARDWFGRATKEGGRDIGDVWAWWLKFEREYGTQVGCISGVRKMLTNLTRLGATALGYRGVRFGRSKAWRRLAVGSQGGQVCGEGCGRYTGSGGRGT
jgi:hypothetical protein